MKTALVAAFVLLLSSGCEPIAVTYTGLNAPPHALGERAPETVEMYMTSGPTRPYKEVAVIKVAKRNALHSDADLINTLRTEGARHGCDAMLFTNQNKSIHGYVGDNVSVAQGVADMTAECLVFTDARVD